MVNAFINDLKNALYASKIVSYAQGYTLMRAAAEEYGWDLNSDGTDIDYTSSGGEALVLIDADPANKLAYFKARLHQFGNDAAAK